MEEASPPSWALAPVLDDQQERALRVLLVDECESAARANRLSVKGALVRGTAISRRVWGPTEQAVASPPGRLVPTAYGAKDLRRATDGLRRARRFHGAAPSGSPWAPDPLLRGFLAQLVAPGAVRPVAMPFEARKGNSG